jgi:hypothetical protein
LEIGMAGTDRAASGLFSTAVFRPIIEGSSTTRGDEIVGQLRRDLRIGRRAANLPDAVPPNLAPLDGQDVTGRIGKRSARSFTTTRRTFLDGGARVLEVL